MTEIIYRDVPLGILEDSTIEFNNKQSFVNVNELKDEVIEVEKYGTLEQDFYLLDGTFKTFPDSPSNMEYMSEEMSDEEGNFQMPITMTRTFTNRYSATGMTIKFDTNTGDYCSKFNIAWYRDNELIDTADFFPTDSEYILNRLVEAFNKVVLTFYKTNKPYRYLKIHYLIDGMVRVFNKKELLNLELLEEVSKTGETLPINTFTFDLIVDKSVAYLFQNKQPIKLYHNNNFMGSFFIESAVQKSLKEFSVSTTDYIGILDAENTYGGLYTAVPITNVLSDILGTISYELDESFADKTVTGYLPISTKRVALQQLAFSIGAIIDTSRSETILILPYPKLASATFDKSKIFRGIQTEIEAIATSVKLTEHNYYTKNETETLYEEILNGTITIELSTPHRAYEITNGTIVASHPNYITITGTGNTVTLTGKIYTDKTRVLKKENPRTTASTLKKEIEFTDCSLICSNNSEEVIDRLADICFNNKTVTCKVIFGDERVGKIATISTDYGAKKAVLLSLVTDLNYKGKYAEAKFMEVE